MSLETFTVLLAGMAAFAAAACPKPTPTGQPPATPICVEPPAWTSGYLDYDLYCKCNPYTPKSPTFGITYQGLVRCDTECAPAIGSQREAHNDPENVASLSTCSNACTGSFEKAKAKRQSIVDDDEYWFCHGVNFKQGELCEFFGSLGSKTIEDQTFQVGGPDCWYLPGLD
ncbi:hypothetical protein F5Y17DRAFT_469105 [Xylariaceae sp. FL0594]|nr:hypothetical protein F5Y17DRAFT_469105 [Xylariaceae sp. FL0594]